MPFMWALWLCRCVQTSAAVLLAGTAVLRLLAWGTDVSDLRVWRRLAFWSWCVLLIAGALQLCLTAAAMSDLPLAQACTVEMLGRVLGTRFGASWQVRVCLLAGIGLVILGHRLAVHSTGGQRAPATVGVPGAVLTAALLTNLVWSGHAHASRHSAWLLPVDVAHMVAAGVWPGGLLPLGFLLARARRDLRMVPVAITVTRRFSRLSLLAVGVLAASGLLNSYGLVGVFSALWPSVYGRLILCKVALFASMVCLGALNRKLLAPPDAADPAATVRRLRRNVAWECGLAVVVLLATEALAMNPPPATG